MYCGFLSFVLSLQHVVSDRFFRVNILLFFQIVEKIQKWLQKEETIFWPVFPFPQFRSDYLPYEIVTRPFRQQEEYRPKSGKIDLGTIYQRDYNPHKVGPVILARPRERKHTSDAKVDTVPTYRGNSSAPYRKGNNPDEGSIGITHVGNWICWFGTGSKTY